jgi:hypothetical protein
MRRAATIVLVGSLLAACSPQVPVSTPQQIEADTYRDQATNQRNVPRRKAITPASATGGPATEPTKALPGGNIPASEPEQHEGWIDPPPVTR